MAKTLRRLATVAAACCVCAGPALAQPHRGAVAAPAPHISAPAPAPHISAPTPHISAPAVPRVSAPAPRIATTPHVNIGPSINHAPHIATQRFPTRSPSVHQFTPRGHGFTGRGFARQPVRGPIANRHALGRTTGRSAARADLRKVPGRGLTENRTPGKLPRASTRERALAKDKLRAGETGRLAKDRNRVTEPNNRPHAATPADRKHPDRAQVAALRHPLGERNRNDNDRHRWFHERRRFHRGGFVGWFGPVFWPYAYDDFFDYAFWPAEYDNYGFWAYAYDDILDNVFFAPGTEEVYASLDRRPVRGAERRRGREISRGTADLCRVDPGLTRWPADQIAQVVEPTGEQQALLDDLKTASARAAKLLQSACPAHPPSTPLGRIDAMAKRLDVMLRALDVVRPALAKFYDSLSDEQKARFNGMGREQSGGTQAKDEARLCGSQSRSVLTDEAIDRIEQDVRPDDRQRAELDALRDATAKASDELRNACPAQTPITPVARLDAMAKRLQAMLDAINTVRPALARFYDSLSDEQKAHFNVMARNQ
jgi:LTXXQ motif family protein